MTRLIRLLLTLAGIVAGSLLIAAPAVAGEPATISGVTLGYLPSGLGDASDFTYEYDDVGIVSRVWESGSDATGWRVDLDVAVMRGARLSDAAALRDWFAAYEDRPVDEARYVPTEVRGQPGWLARDQVFWLVRPGLAASVRLDAARWPTVEALRVAAAARPARCDPEMTCRG